ncbi:Tn3 family transposase [Clostridium frigoris]|uniref:Tn3 family transposase n=1 Tax=Clostridium frigoris TaxID=205327 RepID=A0ABS6BQ31_9CLOT|nr:Tn3 family transposase [Clostridium frigoris]MBU3158380.1 Tn3 family transposase [Clostridium frigoris]
MDKKGEYMDTEQNNTEQKRLRILGENELESIYGRPCFTYEDRYDYFSLSKPEKDLLEVLRSTKSRAYFILQLGYFKAKRLFFIFDLNEVQEDLNHVLQQHFYNTKMVDMSSIDKSTRLKQQQMILQLFTYHICDSEIREQLDKKACTAVAVCGKPIFIFREIINYLSEHHIVIPGYSLMQETVGKAINYEQNRLITIMKNQLKQFDLENLKKLLTDSEGLYEITQLKHEPKDFSVGEIKREINRGQQIQLLYKIVKNLLPTLGISNESVKYYSSLVDYYSVYKLKRFNEWIVYIYLLCFIYHRYQRMNDNLINTLIYNVRHYIDEAKCTAKEQIYVLATESNQNMKKVGLVLKIFTDDRMEINTPFRDVQAKAFSILERQKLVDITDQIVTNVKFDETNFQWEHIDKLSLQFKRHLRQILLMVYFAATLIDDPLIDAINFMKEAFIKNKSLSQYPYDDLPSQFIPDGITQYIYKQDNNGQKVLIVDRYEFLVYRLLRNSLEAGDIFCPDSARFRSFEDDLLDNCQWQQKEKLIAEAGLSIFNKPILNHLMELEDKLETRIIEVNQRIASGDNEHLLIKKRGLNTHWTLPYVSDPESTNHSFFAALNQIDIGSVLHYVNQHCQFIDAFEHVLGRYAKQTKENRVIVACLTAWGTNMGLGRMGEISDISFSLLSATSDSFIRLETLKEANDRVSNATAKLPIFRHYDIDEVIHSSSDGQKFETNINTINSRHSPKYFGLKKGIVSYTLVANHVPVNAKIIGANEHESHYVFDILYNNTSDIQTDIHSTDTHGANEVNFAILHFFDYRFAPRYKDIYNKVSKSFYGFNQPSHYGDILIKPVRKINTDLIVEEWENIQRIILSLALKSTTQSIIIGKLSAYARKNKTKSALWEYDNILKSLYFLDYIDSLPLRKNVQRALNRGESYHKLRRAVSHANFGKLRFKTEQEQQIWGECSRLLANCIIYYNASILSNMLDYRESNGQDLDVLKHISPVAWQHINLYGRYEFNKTPEPINMDVIIQKLAQLQVLPD